MRKLCLPFLLAATLCAACSGGGGDDGAVRLVSISVTAANPSIALGTERQLTATGIYSDSSNTDLTGSATWVSSNEAAATVDAGLVAAVAIGPATISASQEGISGAANVAVSAVALPRTGQAISYSTFSPDDGALKTGVAWPDPRFAVSSSGTGTVVTDKLTGLMWTGDAGTPTVTGSPTCSGGRRIWQEALDYVTCLNTNDYLGYNDWRLPNRKELESLIDRSMYSPALPPGHPFVNVQGISYWSSTWTDSFGWRVDMDTGLSSAVSDFDYYVWPVRTDAGITASISLPRTGQTTSVAAGDDGDLQKGVAWPIPRFAPASSGTGTVVTDNLTGLMWAGDAGTPTFTGSTTCTGGTLNWFEALSMADSYIACLNYNTYLGYDDWRLPNDIELESLLNAGAYTPSLPTGHPFANVQAAYWSSTTYATNSTNYARVVEIALGIVDRGSKPFDYYSVWPVRAGQ